MEEKETTFAEWAETVTTTDVINIIMLVVFSIVITILVVRTFRGKASA